jgi:predicted Zn finger-like uncharacterized protein
MPTVQCPACAQRLDVSLDSLTGRVRCSRCGNDFAALGTTTRPRRKSQRLASDGGIPAGPR